MQEDTTPETSEFQSTLSMRRATTVDLIPQPIEAFQSTLSMRRATWHGLPTTCA